MSVAIKFTPHLLVAGIILLSPAGTLTAGTDDKLCVRCSGPDWSYLCRVDPGNATISRTSQQLFCIRELARSGRHASCSISRDTQMPCIGEPVTLVYGRQSQGGHSAGQQAGLPVKAPSTTGTTAQPTSSGSDHSARSSLEELAKTQDEAVARRQQNSSANRATRQPKTIAELARRTAAASKRQLKKAGRAVSSNLKKMSKSAAKAAKKSWRCLSSLFAKC